MRRSCGYQTMSQLLRRKKHLLNSHILHLCMTMVSAGDSHSNSSAIPNTDAFNDLLCDLEVSFSFIFVAKVLY